MSTDVAVGFDITIDGTDIPAELSGVTLPDDVKAALTAELENNVYVNLSDREILDRLNDTPLMDNPEPPRNVPRPWSPIDLLKAIPAARVAAIKGDAMFPEIMADIRSKDPENLNNAIQYLLLFNLIDTSDAAALAAIVTATMPDPDHPAKIYGPNWMQAHFPGRAIDHADGSSVTGMVTLDMLHAVQPPKVAARRPARNSAPAPHDAMAGVA